MDTTKQDIPKIKIEKEIYNTFELFNKQKQIKIADFLEKINLPKNKNIEYRKIRYSYNSLYKLLLFKNLKGIKYQKQTIQYLKNHYEEALQLGFTEIPDRRTIGYFQNHILKIEDKQLLEYITKTIEQISEKFGILLDLKLFKPDPPKKKTQKRNQKIILDKKSKQICKTFKKRFSPFINLNLNHNTVYSKNQYINMMIHMAQTRDFAENGSKTFKQLQGMKNPDADTLLYHLKKYGNRDKLNRLFLSLFEIVWNMNLQTNTFDKRKPYDVAIDYTEWYYYGDRNTPMIVGKEPDRGTSKCYKFATINIVEAGKRFTLLALPVGPFDRKEEILNKLLRFALKRIRIKRVYIDRGFFDAKSLKVFQKLHLKYLMPATKITTVKKVLEIAGSPTVVNDFPMKDTKFNLVVVEEENDDGEVVKRAFATNMSFDENDVNLAERLFYLYGKRWGIETSYRMKKHSFLPKTTSKNYLIRLFYFMFSVLLYNLWILADILLWLSLHGIVEKDHLLTSKLFGTILYTIDPGG